MIDVSVARSVQALSMAEALADPVLLCTAASGRRLVAASSGDIQEMDRCFEVKRRIVERLDLPFLNWVHTLQLATRAVITGDADEAERLSQTALRLGTDSASY